MPLKKKMWKTKHISIKMLLSKQFPRFDVIWVPLQNHTFLLNEMWEGYLFNEFERCKEVLIFYVLQMQIAGRAEQSDRAVC